LAGALMARKKSKAERARLGRRSSQKGRVAELKVRDFLQEWWRQLEPEARFVRTPRSGGWGVTAGAEFQARGDIMVGKKNCKRFPFCVEVKWRKTVLDSSVEHFFEGKESPVDSFWAQCQEAATHDGLRPLLIFRGNRMPWRAVWIDTRGRRRIALLETFLKYEPETFATES
jgi:hypothetical protein